MKKLTILLIAYFGVLPVAVAGGDIKSGEAKAAACAACHGADGNSAVPNFPKLAGQNANYIAKQLRDINTGKRQVVEMSGLLTGLSDQDFLDMGAYYESKAIQLTGSVDDEEQLALGARIYRAGDHDAGIAPCSGCHSPTGKGNSLAGYPALGGQYAEYIISQLKAFRNEVRTNDGESATMRGVAARMSDKEIAAVANYIAGLH